MSGLDARSSDIAPAGRPDRGGSGRILSMVVGVALGVGVIAVSLRVKAPPQLGALVIFGSLSVLIVALLYLALPLALMRSNWFNPRAMPLPIGPGSPELNDDDANFLDQTLSALAPDGFELTSIVSSSELGPGMLMVAMYYQNRAEDTYGYAVSNRNSVGTREITFRSLQFETMLADGCPVQTVNAGVPSPWPPMRGRVIAVPRVTDPRDLYRIHRAWLKSFDAVARKPIPRGDWLPALLKSQGQQVADHVVRCGYYRPALDDRLRMTVRGAYLSAWKMFPPWSLFRKWRRDRRARPFVRAAGVSLGPPLPGPFALAREPAKAR